jgi:DNA-binding transcriptional MerR regulator
MATGEKAPGAFKTIGELSSELGVAQHILRYWESKFPQLRPLQRAGNRRYYRPADVELARTIHRLLNSEGYTVRGVQKVLRSKDGPSAAPAPAPATISVGDATVAVSQDAKDGNGLDVSRLKAVRQQLAALLDD